VTLVEVIQRSTEFLARKGIESPRLQTELMLACLLHQPRLHLYLNYSQLLSDPDIAKLREWVKRRSQHEPLQYILGVTSFCGIEIAVDSRVLIPRPETEVLAEQAWQFLQSSPGIGSTSPVVLDIGTGSGCLAIAIALRCPSAQVYAVDKSSAALDVAQSNAAKYQVESRLCFLEGDGLNPLDPGLKFNLIVTNPPYIPSSDIAFLQSEVRDFEPRSALDGGSDGLDVFRHLAHAAGDYLKPGGRFMAEFGDNQEAVLGPLFSPPRWRMERMVHDLAGKPRILIAGRE
jgi:release factor glutamine methyltransferase